MRMQRYEGVPRAIARLPLHRRDLLRGGLGLVTGAVLGGLTDSYDRVVAPEPPAEPEREPEAEPEPEPAPDLAPTAYRRGDAGEGVLALQQQLGATGYWCGTPDAVFGHLTQQAVWAVQKAHGLARDGVAGRATQAAVATGHRPVPVAGGDHVEVHLGPQLLMVVRKGATELVLNTSTGNGEPYTFQGGRYTARTPTGDYVVGFVDSGGTKGDGWRDGELGELYRPMFYDGNFAVHGSRSIPPWPDSHGCARVSTAAMDRIWADRLLGMGGRVVVV